MGCVAVVLAIVVAVVAAAWALGAFDRALYLLNVESGRVQTSEHAASMAVGQAENHVYAQLDDEDKDKYLILLDAFQSREERAYPETDMDDLARMRDCVLADHPELFYIGGVQMQTLSNRGSGLVTGVSVEGQYTFSEEEAAVLQARIEEEAASCLAGVPDDADDYGKAKYLYEYLAANVEYDRDAANGGPGALGSSSGQTIADALVAHSAVCAGYAHAYQYLLGKLGIPCVYVTGAANGGGHAWCVALLDGDWYVIDPTWGDPQFLDGGGVIADSGRVNYDYLCVTDDDVAATHVTDCPYAVPSCASYADNYFVREGLFLYEPDIEYAGALIENAAYGGATSAQFRCADEDVYDQVVEALFDGQQIYRFIPGNSCRYLLGDVMLTVEILFD